MPSHLLRSSTKLGAAYLPPCCGARRLPQSSRLTGRVGFPKFALFCKVHILSPCTRTHAKQALPSSKHSFKVSDITNLFFLITIQRVKVDENGQRTPPMGLPKVRVSTNSHEKRKTHGRIGFSDLELAKNDYPIKMYPHIG